MRRFMTRPSFLGVLWVGAFAVCGAALAQEAAFPARPVRMVLEMNTGWFKRHGVKAGDKLSGAPFGTPR